MKFACDRCKTRYTIGDDRVRGKILKIRCKNCANVITVRENMAELSEEPAGVPAPGGSEPSGEPPVASSPGRADPASLAATGAVPRGATPPAGSTEPAPAVEWFVSQDGVQAGPMSLSEAQAWVASKPFDADLHGWSDGLDGWMPIEEIASFRGLRKRPAPAPRPPARPAARPAAGPAPSHASDEAPAPSFASTMAASEAAQATEPAAARPARASSTGVGAGASSDARRAASATAAIADEHRASPAAADEDGGLAIGEVSRVVKLADLAPRPAPVAGIQPGAPEAATPRSQASPKTPTFRQGASAGTAGAPKLSPEDLGMDVDPAILAAARPGEALPEASVVASSFARRHRRSTIALFAVSIFLVAGAVGLFVFVSSDGADEVGDGLGGLGGVRQIDMSRPEDVVRRAQEPERGSSAGPGSATQVATQLPRPRPRPLAGAGSGAGGVVAGPKVASPQGGILKPGAGPQAAPLQPSEVEDMVARQSEGTRRCYMRAQKGAMGVEMADVKKINVTLTVGRDGIVGAVDLSSHGNDTFGQCLIARIKAWKFRESASGGTFRISLAFSSV